MERAYPFQFLVTFLIIRFKKPEQQYMWHGITKGNHFLPIIDIRISHHGKKMMKKKIINQPIILSPIFIK